MQRFLQFAGPKGAARYDAAVGPHRFVVAVLRAAGRDDQDRSVVQVPPAGLFAALADGAKSSGRGREAAEAVVRGLTASPLRDAGAMGAQIVAVDDALAADRGGQATALAFFLGAEGLVGAGVVPGP